MFDFNLKKKKLVLFFSQVFFICILLFHKQIFAAFPYLKKVLFLPLVLLVIFFIVFIQIKKPEAYQSSFFQWKLFRFLLSLAVLSGLFSLMSILTFRKFHWISIVGCVFFGILSLLLAFASVRVFKKSLQ